MWEQMKSVYIKIQNKQQIIIFRSENNNLKYENVKEQFQIILFRIN